MRERHDLSVRLAETGDLDGVAEVWHDSAVSMDGAGPDVPSREALRLRIGAELQAGWSFMSRCVTAVWWVCWP